MVNIALPPLRSRREDVPLLAEHYLRLASVENGFKPKRLTPRAIEFLSQLPWRGNVRELRNLMERLAVLVSRDGVTHRDVMEALHMTAPALRRRRGAAAAAGRAVALRAPVHPGAAVREPGQPGPDGEGAGHRADEPLPQDEAARDQARRGRAGEALRSR